MMTYYGYDGDDGDGWCVMHDVVADFDDVDDADNVGADDVAHDDVDG